MKPTIEIPDDLRAEVEAFIPSVRKEIEELQAVESSEAMEIGKFEAQHGEVSNEIQSLQGEALTSSDKAASLTAAEKRLQLIKERVEALKREASARQPVRMRGLDDLLARIARHWSSALPDAIASALAPFCQDKAKVRNISALCDCTSHAQQVRYLQYQDASPIATERKLQQYEVLFARVLRGQPHLGFDREAAPATTEAGA
jgi:TolA-binding protein